MIDPTALYAATYEQDFLTRKDELSYQRKLARALLYAALKLECGAAGEDLVLKRDARGKPFFQDFPVRFNLSHCGKRGRGMVCCALSGVEVGVDCETLRPYSERLARRICTGRELAALQAAADPGEALTALWTQKESYLKWTGEGFRQGLRTEVQAVPGISLKTYEDVPGFLVTLCVEQTRRLPELQILCPSF